MPATRKHHLKSRHGCQQCKARRQKCDEVRPVCTKCARKGSACSFSEDPSGLIFVEGPNSRKFLQKQREASASAPAPDPNSVPPLQTQGSSAQKTHTTRGASISSIDGQDRRSSGGGSGGGGESYPSLSPPQQDDEVSESDLPPAVTHLEADNLRLMRHFTLHAWRSCVSDPDGETEAEMCTLWRDIVPELACAHPFLLHGVLAAAALHHSLAGACEPDRSTPPTFLMPPRPSAEAMANLARHHHARALPLLRAALADPIPNEHRPPLFAATALVAIYAVGSALLGSPDASQGLPPGQDPVQALVQVIHLMAGISSIVKPVEEYIMQTPFRSYMLPTTRDPYASLGPATEAFFAALHAFVASEAPAHPDPAAAAPEYALAMGMLRHTFAMQRESPGRQMAAIPFPALVPRLVVTDMAASRPAALCIAAGYAVTLHWLRRHIWTQGWGRCVVREIAERLHGTEARRVMQYCVDVVEADDEIGEMRAMPVSSGDDIRNTVMLAEALRAEGLLNAEGKDEAMREAL